MKTRYIKRLDYQASRTVQADCWRQFLDEQEVEGTGQNAESCVPTFYCLYSPSFKTIKRNWLWTIAAVLSIPIIVAIMFIGIVCPKQWWNSFWK